MNPDTEPKTENTQNMQPEPTTQGKTSESMNNQQKDTQNLLRITTGLPKHGTRWARAQNPSTERA
jgi:hypothetical protein